MELKQRVSSEDLHPGVHAKDTYPVIGCWGPSFQGIACPIPTNWLYGCLTSCEAPYLASQKAMADHLTPPMFSPQSLTLALDLEEETSKICEELWQTRNLTKIKKENAWILSGNSASWAQVSEFKFIY